MPNHKHNRKLFESALEQVHKNDETIQNLYGALTEQSKTQNQQQLNEIVGSLLIGLAAAAPAVATGVGMYQKHKKEERARQDELKKIEQDRAERAAQAEAERKHRTSERLGGETFKTGESAEERKFKEKMTAAEQGFQKGESAEERKFRRGERLGTQRHSTGMSREQMLQKLAIEMAKQGAKAKRRAGGKGKKKGKGTP